MIEGLAKRLLTLRRDRGLTIRQVSDATGISWSAVRAHEQGKRGIMAYNLYMLAKFYNVTSDYLLGLEIPQNCDGCRYNKQFHAFECMECKRHYTDKHTGQCVSFDKIANS